MEKFIRNIPKAELHLHIEGTLEPELMFQLAQKNHIKLPYASVTEIHNAYYFSDLQSFLDIYYQGMQVLQEESDFYDLTWNYLAKAAKQNVRHVEIFFDPQAHTDRKVSFDTVIGGIHRALVAAEKALGISSKLIMCFLRDQSVESAIATLEQALPYKEWITAVGLDSAERNYPPKKFQAVFDKARQQGFLAVAHAGEEGPADYISQALDLLHVSRIDHGVRCLEDEKLVERLVAEQIPLTVCPISNIKLCVYQEMAAHPIKRMYERGLMVTINSDDPAYFKGYVVENYLAVQKTFALSKQDIYQLAKNSFNATFLSFSEKQHYLTELDSFYELNK